MTERNPHQDFPHVSGGPEVDHHGPLPFRRGLTTYSDQEILDEVKRRGMVRCASASHILLNERIDLSGGDYKLYVKRQLAKELGEFLFREEELLVAEETSDREPFSAYRETRTLMVSALIIPARYYPILVGTR